MQQRESQLAEGRGAALVALVAALMVCMASSAAPPATAIVDMSCAAMSAAPPTSRDVPFAYAVFGLLGLGLLLGLGFCVGWQLRGCCLASAARQPPTRTMKVQALCTYTATLNREQPRFLPLGDREHGAWCD